MVLLFLSMFVVLIKIPSVNASTSTFGYTTVGSSVWASVAPTVMLGCQSTLSQAGALTSIEIYTCAHPGSSGNMVAAVYADSSGAPGALIAYSSPVALPTTPSWVSFPVSASLAAGTYWLACVSDAYPTLYYDMGTTNQCAANYASSEIYPTCPALFNPTSWAYSNNELSMYATYTTTTSTAPPQDPAFGNTAVGSSVWASVAPTVMLGCQSTLSQAGALTSIEIYTCAHPGSSGNMVAAVYADSSGAPGALIAYSSPVALPTTPSWVSFPVSASLAAGTYWLACVSDAYPTLYYDMGTTNQCAANYASSEIYPTCPALFNPTSWAYSNNELSMYATYTTTTSTAPPQDPAFGNTAVGSSVWASVAPTVMLGCQSTLSQAGALTSIEIYTCAHPGSSGNMVAAVYADSSGAPGALIAYSSPVALPTTPSWVSFPVSASLAAGTYWLACVSDAYPTLYYDMGTTNQCAANYASSEIYPTCPALFNPTSWAYSNNELSMYATYTTTAPPAGNSYIMAVSGSNYQMLDGATGTILYQSTDSAQVFSDIVGNCSAGSSIYVESGVYTVNTMWTMLNVNDITINFESGAELVAGNGLDTPVLMIGEPNDPCNNIQINGITINGNAANQAITWIPIDYGEVVGLPDGIGVSGSNVEINNADIFNCRVMGVSINWIATDDCGDATGSPNCGVIDSKIYDCGWNAFTVYYGLNCYLLNSEIYGCSDVGVSASGGTGTYISGNYVHDMDGNTGSENSEWGIAVEGGGSDTITNNTVYNAVIGIQISGFNYNTVSDNTVSCSPSYYVAYGYGGAAGQTYGINGAGSQCTITDNTVTGMLCNTATTNGGMGINWAGTLSTISGNTVSNCGSAGICLNSGATSNTVSSNTISGTGTGRDYTMQYGGCGIEVVAGDSNNYISQNQVFNNSNYGIAFDLGASNNTLQGNNVYNNVNGQIYDPNIPENTIISQ